MEEEKKVEPQVEVQNEAKKFNFKNFDYKKYLPWAGIAVAVVAIIIILALVLGGGPKKAVKGFISGMNSKNASKILKNIDFAGVSAWGYSYDEDDFTEEDYNSFIKDYKDVDKDKIKDKTKYMKDSIEDSFDDMDDEYKSYKIKVEKFKDVEKLGKDLYAVDAKISVEAKPKDKDETDEIDESEVVTFILYKNKLISFGGIGF